MENSLHTDLTGIAIVALAALLCGAALERLRQPAIVGYILAGLILGPSAFGLVRDRGEIDSLAELGVLMLLFMIGLELSLRAFVRIWRLAILTMALQVGCSVLVMLGLAQLLDWPPGLALLVGFAVALSSTAVAIKILEGIGELRTRAGRIAVAVLIAQDLAVVPMMVTVNAMAGPHLDWTALLRIVAPVALLFVLVWYLSRSGKMKIPLPGLASENPELVRLTGLVTCFGAAAVSGIVGLSPAYGAFLAGLVIGNSMHRSSMVSATHPVQSLLMMVFFLSIGLLIDLDYIWANLATVLVLLLLVTVLKTAFNIGILRLLGQSWPNAFLAGVVLAQIGEFSFLITLTGINAGLIDRDTSRLVISVTALSLAMSPVWVVSARRLHERAQEGAATIGELLQLVYADEAEMMSDGLDTVRFRAVRRLRWLRLVYRHWRRTRVTPPPKLLPPPAVPAADPPAERQPGEARRPSRSPPPTS